MPLNVSEGTLIPRPDTEILVEKALQIALEKLEENPPHFRILDLGTGTGAIALALASELFPICQKKTIQLDVIGVDLMPEVVKLAQANAEKISLRYNFFRVVGLNMLKGSLILSSVIRLILMKPMNIFSKAMCVSSLVRRWCRVKTV